MGETNDSSASVPPAPKVSGKGPVLRRVAIVSTVIASTLGGLECSRHQTSEQGQSLSSASHPTMQFPDGTLFLPVQCKDGRPVALLDGGSAHGFILYIGTTAFRLHCIQVDESTVYMNAPFYQGKPPADLITRIDQTESESLRFHSALGHLEFPVEGQALIVERILEALENSGGSDGEIRVSGIPYKMVLTPEGKLLKWTASFFTTVPNEEGTCDIVIRVGGLAQELQAMQADVRSAE